jgi:hypothetical protein
MASRIIQNGVIYESNIGKTMLSNFRGICASLLNFRVVTCRGLSRRYTLPTFSRVSSHASQPTSFYDFVYVV